MSKVRLEGFVRWYDEKGDDGILTDFDGNEYYFNSWSFALTNYRVTVICNETGKKKTVSNRKFPGIFLERKEIKDFRCKRLKHAQPVRFRQADGIYQRWAVEIAFAPSLAEKVLDYKIQSVLDGMLACDLGHERFPEIWRPYYVKRLAQLLEAA